MLRLLFSISSLTSISNSGEVRAKVKAKVKAKVRAKIKEIKNIVVGWYMD